MLDPFHLIHLETDPGDGGDGGGEGDPGDSTPPEPPEGEPSDDPKDKVIAELRKENASHRRKNKQLEGRVGELEGASQTELEKAQTGKKTAEERAAAAEADNRLLRARLIAGAVGVDEAARADAARLLDWDKIEDPTDDDEIEAAMQDLVKDRPYLLGRTAGGGDQNAGGQRRNAQEGDMNRLIRSSAGIG